MAVVAALGVVAGAAVAANGFDVQKLPINSSTIWVLQNGQGERYGQVNTELSELTSANAASKPTRLAQADTGVLLFSAGDTRFTPVNVAAPKDFDEDPANYQKAPAQTKAVESGSSVVAYLAGKGELLLSPLNQVTPTAPAAVTMPLGTDSAPVELSAISVAQSAGGADVVYGLSLTDGKVHRFDTNSQTWLGAESLPSPPTSGDFQITASGSTWAVLDTSTGKLWMRGKNAPLELSITDGLQLQNSTPETGLVYVANTQGLVAVDVETMTEKVVTSTSGVATRPSWFDTAVYASWLSQGTSAGSLYSSATNNIVPLEFNGKALTATPTPVINVNGRTGVINETSSGWVWRIPDGKLVPSSQDWSLIDRTPDQTSSKAEVTKVTTPKPPVAESDVFGVRAGAMVSLPILLNDHDPNKDVLAVDPASVSSIDPGFGSVRVSNQGQMLVANIAPGASGSVSFSYRVSDGTAAEGLYSNSTSVTLTVVGADNSPPVWCADIMKDCLQKWPDVQVAPGGTVSVPVLDGWVDREGDRIFIAGVDVPEGRGIARFTADGQLVYQSEDAGSKEASDVTLTVHVSDSNSAVADKPLTIHITPDPVLAMTPFAVSTAVDQAVTVDVASAATGVTGELRVQSAKPQSDASGITIEQVAGTTFKVSGSKASEAIIAVVLADEGGEASSFVRLRVVTDETAHISSSPVTVLVSPGLDSTINVFSAAHNPSGRALIVSNVVAKPNAGGSLFADPIQGGNIRVRGATAEGLPGLIGIFTYTLSDGSTDARFQTTGQALVYQLPEPPSQAPVGRPDSVTVRVGGAVDVDVLANDVGSPGVPLVLDAASFAPECITGGLIFAGGAKARIVAPSLAGTYTCAYSLYSSGNPVQRGSSRVVIHVIGSGANSAPQPLDISSRAQAGSSVKIPIKLDGIDPDGDSVSVIAVSGPKSGLGFASLNEERNAVIFSAVPGASGQDSFTYTVKDAQGAVAVANIRVGVTVAEFNPAPITMTDYTEIVAGTGKKAVVVPSENDIDPQGEALTLVAGSVKPDAAEGTPIYVAMAKAITGVEGNAVTFTGGTTPTTMRFAYSVRNSSGSISTGIIIVKVSATAATQFPEIIDTFVTLTQRSSLSSGVDVVDQKVSWSSGDINTLKLSVWGDARVFSASGRKISGVSPDAGTVVVFKLEGTDFAGVKVASYGLMHVPSIIDVPLTLDPDKARQEVKEKESKTFSMSDLVSLPAGMSLEVDTAKVRSLGQRAQGTCVSAGGTSVTYEAGTGDPWQDGCVVPVRISGGQEFTTLMVPITVIPANPEPELSKRQVTVIPGDSREPTEFDLTSMTTWYGHPDLSSLTYTFDNGAENLFKIVQDGQKLKIIAFGSSPTGSTGTVMISVSNHPKTAPAPLVLVVGISPNGGPVGGSLTKSCKASDNGCTISVGEITGAYNPFPDTALKFAPFNYTGGVANYASSANVVACGGVKLRAEAGALVASWDRGNPPESVHCPNITYRVLDKDGKSGRGSLNFTLQGSPGSPGRVTQTGYTSSTITILIEAGNSGQSDPATVGYHIFEKDGSAIDCPLNVPGEASTTCRLEGLNAYDGRPEDAGDLHTYTVKAYNEVGDSIRSRTLSGAYAYKPPRSITPDVFLEMTPTYSSKFTSTNVGIISARIQPLNDPIVSRYLITGEGQTGVSKTMTDFSAFTIDVPAKPGFSSRITVQALGRVGPPGGTSSPEASAAWTGTVSGAPSLEKVEGSSVGSRTAWSAKVTALKPGRNYSTKDSKFTFVVWEDSASVATPKCTWDATSNTFSVSGATLLRNVTVAQGTDQTLAPVSSEIPGLADLKGYKSKVCFTNGFGYKELSSASFGTLSDPDSGAFTYEVSPTPIVANNTAEWRVALTAQPSNSSVTAQFNGGDGWRSAIYSSTWGARPTIKVRYCLSNGSCSPGERLVTGSNPNRAWQMKITAVVQTDASGNIPATYCAPNAALYFKASGPNLGSGSQSLWKGDKPIGSPTTAQYYDGATWRNLTNNLSYFKIPLSATVTKMKIFVSGSSVTAVSGLTDEAALEVPCHG